MGVRKVSNSKSDIQRHSKIFGVRKLESLGYCVAVFGWSYV